MGKVPEVRSVIDPDDDPVLTRYGTPEQKPVEKKEDKAPEAKPDDKKDEKKTDVKPPEKKEDKPADAKPDEKPPGRKTGWQMYHEEEKKTKALQEQIAKLNREVGERKTPEDFKIDDHPEFKSTKEKLSNYEKKLAELQDKIRFVDYESSDEYKEKFHRPYVEAWQHGKASIEQMKVLAEEGQTPRNGTVEDLQRIVQAQSIEEATQIAEQLFGPTAKASYALSLRDRIIQRHDDALKAREEFRTKGSEQMKLSAAEQERQSAERAEKFNSAADEAVEKYPHWFKPEEGDDQGNQLLDIGFMLANAAFGGQIKDGKTGEMRDPTPDEIPLIHAQLRNKAAGFDRLAYKNQKLQARITELEDTLSKYEETEPPPGDTIGKKSPDGEDDPFAKYDKK